MHMAQWSAPTGGAVFEVRLEDEEDFPEQGSRRRAFWADEIECTKAPRLGTIWTLWKLKEIQYYKE